jgi:TonB family protein
MTANDRFKAAWGGRVAGCMAAAAAAHVALLLWFPDILARVSPDAREPRPVLEWVVLDEGRAGAVAPGTAALALPPAAAAPAGTRSDGDDDESVVGRDRPVDDARPGSVLKTARTLGAEALRDYLLRRTGSAGSIVAGDGHPGGGEPGRGPVRLDASVPRSVDAERAAEDRRMEGSASTTGTVDDGDGDGVGLGRLSAIRPELAYSAPLPWILIENPDEVEGYMSRRFRDAGVQGTVSVALWIDERGSVEWAEINRSTGRSDVDQSALELFSRVATYRPARHLGVRVPIAVLFSLTFPL